jgi:hypothetical protein
VSKRSPSVQRGGDRLFAAGSSRHERICSSAPSRRSRNAATASCNAAYKACFCDDEGRLTLEGGRVLADLRERSMLFKSAIRRDGRGVIDREELARIEGRREIVLRIINALELDPLGVARLMEVDDA